MQVKEAFELLVKSLSDIYSAREAGNMATIVFEDVFPEINLNQEQPLSENQTSKLLEIKARLMKHEPLQHVIGWADFYGLRFKSDRRALIPRPETEELVHLIIKDIRKKTHTGEGGSLLDIGTGTGCIPLTVKHHLPLLSVTGADVSKEAIALAKENQAILQLEAQMIQLDILNRDHWVTLPNYDIIVSNPPYIPVQEKAVMSRNVLDYEPDLALFVADNDPLVFYQIIVEFALLKLKAGGTLYFEVNEFNGSELLEWMRTKGFSSIEGVNDMHGKLRMVRGRRRKTEVA